MVVVVVIVVVVSPSSPCLFSLHTFRTLKYFMLHSHVHFVQCECVHCVCCLKSLSQPDKRISWRLCNTVRSFLPLFFAFSSSRAKEAFSVDHCSFSNFLSCSIRNSLWAVRQRRRKRERKLEGKREWRLHLPRELNVQTWQPYIHVIVEPICVFSWMRMGEEEKNANVRARPDERMRERGEDRLQSLRQEKKKETAVEYVLEITFTNWRQLPSWDTRREERESNLFWAWDRKLNDLTRRKDDEDNHYESERVS